MYKYTYIGFINIHMYFGILEMMLVYPNKNLYGYQKRESIGV